MSDYEFEDIRLFTIRRNWMMSAHLEGEEEYPFPITQDEYEGLKARKLSLSAGKARDMRMFIRGYLSARPANSKSMKDYDLTCVPE